MNILKLTTYIGLGAYLFSSCSPNLKADTASSGDADFSRYVAIGNSLTSGYADGALSLYGQENSFPKMLAEKFAEAGGGEFKIPYMDAGNGNDGQGHPKRVLGYVIPCNSSSPTIGPKLANGTATPLNNVAANGPYNLVGVPGARSYDAILSIYSSSFGNPFLNRFCKTPGVSTMLSEALRSNPTFYTMWLGNNDALLYATGGAVAPTGFLSPSLTDTTTFGLAMRLMIDSLSKTGAKGAIANIPDVTSVPYFTTIPWNAVVLTQGKADTLNAIFAGANLTNITWNAGPNGLLIVDSSEGAINGFMRHATAEDLILITTPGDSLTCGQWGVNPYKALRDQYVLDKNEKIEIQERIAQYNDIIKTIANAYNLAHVDMNSYIKSFVPGIIYNGISMNAKYITGGAFSLDGIHPNPRGYALIANEFIKSINNKFKATISLVDVSQYNGIVFP
ncbi:MAG: SGNH/GDSL hydrolase family protein [Chitinophagaceae bacterium]